MEDSSEELVKEGLPDVTLILQSRACNGNLSMETCFVL